MIPRLGGAWPVRALRSSARQFEFGVCLQRCISASARVRVHPSIPVCLPFTYWPSNPRFALHRHCIACECQTSNIGHRSSNGSSIRQVVARFGQQRLGAVRSWLRRPTALVFGSTAASDDLEMSRVSAPRALAVGGSRPTSVMCAVA